MLGGTVDAEDTAGTGDIAEVSVDLTNNLHFYGRIN